MDRFLKLAYYLFHPLCIPTYGVLLYFLITPRFVPQEVMIAKVLVVFILTFLIPVVFYFILKNISLVSSIHLKTVKERKAPLVILFGILFLMIQWIFDAYDYPALYYFFLAMMISVLSAIILVYFNYKTSLHMMGISAVAMFAMALSIHFGITILLTISFLLFACGWVASSRLHSKSHTISELVIGFFVGWIPQLLMVNYWL